MDGKSVVFWLIAGAATLAAFAFVLMVLIGGRSHKSPTPGKHAHFRHLEYAE